MSTKTKPAPKKLDPKQFKELAAMEKRLSEMQAQFQKKGLDKKKQDELLGPLRKKIEDFKKKHNIKTFDPEVITAGEPVIVEEKLGPLRWGKKYRGDLWAITDTEGRVVLRGAGGVSNDLARINSLGQMALRGIADMEKLDEEREAASAVVKKATDQGAADVKTLEKAKTEISKRNDKDEDFHEDVDGYLKVLKAAELKVDPIKKAELDLNEAVELLRANVYAYEYKKEQDKAEKTEQELKSLKDEIDAAKDMFKEVMDIAIKVSKLDWEGLATKAISAYADKTIEAAYALQLEALQKALKESKSKMNQLKEKELVTRVNAAQFRMESATKALKIANDALKANLEELERAQKNAYNELNESKSTAIAGKMLDDRTKQLNSIALSRAACNWYLRAAKRLTEDVAKISDQYGKVGTFLDMAVKTDPAFDQNKPYGKHVYLWAIKNSVSLNNWRNWVNGVQSECNKELQWLDQQGAKGPMAPFDQAIVQIKQGLGQSS